MYHHQPHAGIQDQQVHDFLANHSKPSYDLGQGHQVSGVVAACLIQAEHNDIEELMGAIVVEGPTMAQISSSHTQRIYAPNLVFVANGHMSIFQVGPNASYHEVAVLGKGHNLTGIKPHHYQNGAGMAFDMTDQLTRETILTFQLEPETPNTPWSIVYVPSKGRVNGEHGRSGDISAHVNKISAEARKL